MACKLWVRVPISAVNYVMTPAHAFKLRYFFPKIDQIGDVTIIFSKKQSIPMHIPIIDLKLPINSFFLTFLRFSNEAI